MNKYIAFVGVMFVSVISSGCSDMTEYDKKKEMLLIEQAHQREMARIQSNQQSYVGDTTMPVQQPYQDEPQHYNNDFQQAQSEEGFGGGDMVMAAMGGAAAAYIAGEMLDNGFRSYKDDKGVRHYTDRNGKPVSAQSYEDYKKKNPRVSKIQEKASEANAKVRETAAKGVDKAKQTATKVNNSQQVQKVKQETKKAASKVKQKAKSYSSSKKR